MPPVYGRGDDSRNYVSGVAEAVADRAIAWIGIASPTTPPRVARQTERSSLPRTESSHSRQIPLWVAETGGFSLELVIERPVTAVCLSCEI